MALYRIVEWEQYQHYRDRSPPWIKLHRGTLTSRTWVTLDDAGRVLAVACMLIAADTGNEIPTDPAYIRRRAYLDHDPDFAPLVAVGFIELVSDIKALAEDRKHMLAPRKQVIASACSESEGEREQRRGEEKDNSASTRSAERRGSRLAEDWKPSAEDRAFAADHGLDPDLTTDEFRDFWTAVPGARGRKLDWSKTFKNRCRELGKRPSAAGRGEARQADRDREIREAIERSKLQ